jgi:hypothetical protein
MGGAFGPGQAPVIADRAGGVNRGRGRMSTVDWFCYTNKINRLFVDVQEIFTFRPAGWSRARGKILRRILQISSKKFALAGRRQVRA